MSTPASKLIAKEEKVLTAVAESVGSTLGSLAAKVNNAASAMIPKPAARRRAVKRARKTIRKAAKSVKHVAAKAKRKSTSNLRKAARKVRRVRRSLGR
jgi:methylphosphotriester-DNA--protein-cysteine methyltransferase